MNNNIEAIEKKVKEEAARAKIEIERLQKQKKE